MGNSPSSDFGWVDFGESFNLTPHSFYGFSDVITVAAQPVLESSSITLGLTVIALLGFGCSRKRRAGCFYLPALHGTPQT